MRSILFAIYFLLVFIHCAFAAEQKQGQIPFPIPTREMRLIDEAQDPASPISHLLELSAQTSPNRVRVAALQALGERGDKDVLLELEKRHEMAPLDGLFTQAIRQMRKQQGLEKTEDAASKANAWIEYLQTNSVSLQDYRKGNYVKFRNHSTSLLELANMGDKRALPLIEEYLVALQDRHRVPHNPIDNDKELSDAGSRLEDVYWKLKIKGMTLQQKLELFKAAGSDAKSPVSFYAIESVLVEEGQAIVPILLPLFQDKKAAPVLREVAGRILMQIPNTAIASSLVAIADDLLDDDRIRSLTLTILARQGHPKAVAATLKILEQEKGNETLESYQRVMPQLYRVETLAKAGVDKRMLEKAILPYLEKSSSTAVMVAREVGGNDSVEPLINIIKEPKAPTEASRVMVRWSAITSLGFTAQRIEDKDNRVLMFLISMSYDKDPLTRIPAVQALARIRKQTVIPVLLDLIKTEKDHNALWFQVSGIYLAGGEAAVRAFEETKQLAEQNKNSWLLELSEEGLLRLKREGRTAPLFQNSN